ncbi:hypothetical protein BSZ28_24510 [Pseudomonas moraviensis]|nr:hypothetical protein BSZ28_24510 [Pseudomonas moraviensis]
MSVIAEQQNGLRAVFYFLSTTKVTLWERACSRKRSVIQHYGCLTHRLREQARSHRDTAESEIFYKFLAPPVTHPPTRSLEGRASANRLQKP